MYPRFQLSVIHEDHEIYSRRFKSLTNLIKFAFGFRCCCDIYCYDTVFDKDIDIDYLLDEFKESCDYA